VRVGVNVKVDVPVAVAERSGVKERVGLRVAVGGFVSEGAIVSVGDSEGTTKGVFDNVDDGVAELKAVGVVEGMGISCIVVRLVQAEIEHTSNTKLIHKIIPLDWLCLQKIFSLLDIIIL